MTHSVLNLLLADDNRDDATLFRMALDKAKVSVDLQIVSDGEQTIAYLKGEGQYADRAVHPIPDLLLLDLNMPRKNGFEVLEWIRGDDVYKPLIVHVLSASSRVDDVRRVYDLQANSYLIKPGRVQDLVALIQCLVAFTQISLLPPLGRARPGISAEESPSSVNRAREPVNDLD